MTTNVVETESTRAVVTENNVTNTVEVTSAGPAGPPGGLITVQDNGVTEGQILDKLNFAGSTVSVVNDTVNEVVTVTVNAANPGANANITSLTGITGGISSPDFIQFDTAAAATGAVGRVLWNDTEGTLEFQMKGGNVTLQIGKEQVLRVTNQSGSTMNIGQVVYITGSTGNHLNVTLSQANSEMTSSKTLAVIAESISNNQTGFATTSGIIGNLDTSALTEGAAIWLSPTVPGGMTSTKPSAPNHTVLVGWCVRQHATVGAIYVHIANGYELDELHNVQITSVADKQVLRYDSATTLWKNATVSPTLTLAGDATGSATFTSLGDATVTVTVVDDSHNHIISNVDGLQDALDSKLASSSYTAEDVLTKIKTVDGAGSGLDADLLDGQSSAYYTAINDRLGYTAENAANKGVANGYASLDGSGTVPTTQLPAAVLGAVKYQGTWNASTNTPTLASSTGTQGYYYVVSVAGTTNLNGISDWQIGDWAIYNGSIWQKIDNTDAVNSVNGKTGAVVLTTSDVAEGTNEYFTTARARSSISASGSLSYNSTTGVVSYTTPTTDGITEGSTNLYYTNARARSAISATGSLSYNSTTGVISFTDAVTSVAGKTGVVTLTNADVGLGNVENKSSATIRSEITSGNVTTALGYTPVNKAGDTVTGSLAINGNTTLGDAIGDNAIVPDQMALEYTATSLPDILPTLNLDFINSQVIDPRITFTRSSTATFYDGRTTALAEQNLLTYSQDWTNAVWSKAAISVTGSSGTAPDGTNTATLITADGTTATHASAQLITASTAQKVFSFYAKAGTNNFIQMYAASDSGVFANFDLSGGTVGTVGGAVTATITSVGSGWYRCVIVTSSSTAASMALCVISSGTAARAESNSLATTVLVWGAQLEQRSTATAYTATTASPITNYIPALQTAAANVGRLDYDPVTRSPKGLLIEEQRTNLLTYSEQFNNAFWTNSVSGTGSAPIITANAGIAPDGTQTADQVVFNSGAGTTLTDRSIISSSSISVTASTTYTHSIFVKGPAGTKLVMRGAAGSSYTSITLTGGWDRFTGSEVTGSNIAYFEIGIRQSVTGTINSTATVLLWGAQLEAGAFATSYIPTVASQVTRSADSAILSGTNFSSWWNQNEGAFFASWSGVGSFYSFATAGAGNSGNDSLFIYSPANYTAQAYNGGVLQANVTSSAAQGTVVNAAAAFATNNFAASFNGAAAVADTSYVQPIADKLAIGRAPNTTIGSGYIRHLTYYPIRLSNTVLQGMTK